MSSLVTYQLADGIASIAMDDGRANAMSISMLTELHACFARAEADAAVVLLSGRAGIFSAGFDMKVFPQGREPTLKMLHLGATLAERLLSFPFPVVTACTGHAYPMGAFLMLSADRRIGVAGDFRIGMNEVAIGLTLPRFAIEIARQRLTPAYFQRAVTGDMYGPEEAVVAGFLDEVVAVDQLTQRSREVAHSLTSIDYESHAATKMRMRSSCLETLRNVIESELVA